MHSFARRSRTLTLHHCSGTIQLMATVGHYCAKRSLSQPKPAMGLTHAGLTTYTFLCTRVKCIKSVHQIWDSIHLGFHLKIWDSRKHGIPLNLHPGYHRNLVCKIHETSLVVFLLQFSRPYVRKGWSIRYPAEGGVWFFQQTFFFHFQSETRNLSTCGHADTRIQWSAPKMSKTGEFGLQMDKVSTVSMTKLAL